ncbi:hypothetical protein TTHERM_00048780 (macronuclear) [Tetrahymena thermophila SB210]|uniref:Uncharacterized protein n=1 Tax=Tetrahymena thermophila (strain SB210) TaxID=312017 RepID=Q23DB2_TETTS|nr:hypothetical protein TTHERM_00048780 [Tetrahymena thermophila SB210]EAR94464.2 hypothetical protein TTHERM_00048780 [Tetrahymena thermophila SB210]|eukprot:XP_001014774.2 hypothetical protein TTHERM_00048780 [Tetrahymena thermophila SB210]
MEIEYNKKLYQAAEETDVNIQLLLSDFQEIFEKEKVSQKLDQIQLSFSHLNEVSKSIPGDHSYQLRIQEQKKISTECKECLKQKIEEIKLKMKNSDELLKEEMNKLQKLKQEKKQYVEDQKKKVDKEFRQELLKFNGL